MYSVSQRFEQFFKKIFSKSKKSADERHIFDPWIWIYFGGPDFPNCAVSLSTNNTHYIWLKFWTTKGVLDHFYRKKPHTDVVKLLWEVARTGLLCQFSYLQTLGGFFYHKKTRWYFFGFEAWTHIQIKSDQTERLLNKPYVNKVTLTKQNPPLKYC